VPSIVAARTAKTPLGKVNTVRRAFLLPVVFVTYSLAYLDRANYGFGAAAGLAGTLHITEQRSALLGALFFLGYFAFQIPGMLVARRYSSTRLAFFALLVWGVLAALTGVIRSFAWLAADRMLLGVAESVIFPALLLLLTRWFTRAERSRANTMLMLGNPVTVLWMSVLTGFLIQRFGWQRTFILEGLPATLWAFVWLAIVRDEPAQAGWVPAAETQRLRAEHAAEPSSVHFYGGEEPTSLLQVLRSRSVILLSLQYFCWSVAGYGFVLWLPTIVRRAATAASGGHLLSMGSTGLLSAVPYLVAIVAMLIVSQRSDRSLRRTPYVWPFHMLAAVFMFGSSLSTQHFGVAFGCLVLAGGSMYAPYGPYFAIIPERVPRRYTGEAFALINSVGALGGFAGSYLVGVLNAVTGGHRAGDLVVSFSLLASSLFILALPPLPVGATAPEAAAARV
jgi:sugar phosphate permease